MNEIKEAKPCPFCGEKPAFSGDPSEWQDDNRYVELSIGCCTSMREVIGWQRAREMSVKQRRDELESRLISRWNDRSRAEEQREEAHPDDVAVDNFVVAMKGKLAHSRGKGRDGWERCSRVELSRMLREHVDKGDPIDVANFCMFLWSLRQPIEPSVAVNEQSLEALNTALNGLQWYHIAFPDTVDEGDYEAVQEIEAAIAAVQEQIKE